MDPRRYGASRRPTAGGPTKKRKPPVYLTVREREVLLEAAAETAPRGVRLGGLRDVALIALAVFSGLRIAEMAALDRDDVDLEIREIHVRHGKGDKERKVPLHHRAASAIDEYLRARSDQEPALFLSRRGTRASVRALRDVVYRVVREAGLTKHISPHKLRHTFASLLYAKRGNLILVKELMGHQSIETTQIYTHVLTDASREEVDEL